MRNAARFLIYVYALVLLSTAGHLAMARQNQPFIITGRVTDAVGTPIIHAHITTSNAGSGAVTNEDGTFTFPHEGEFPLTIVISAIGYQTEELVIKDLLHQAIDIQLKEDRRALRQVDVIGNRINNRHSQRIDPIHVRALPSAAGPGIEGLVRSQMGVTSNNELSSQYRVRGGNFDENLVYVNGQEVYRPFLMHSGQQEGLSFVNPDLVEKVEFSAGGFSAAYGDKMSSVLDITYKKPRQTAGSFSAGMLGSNGHLEGAAFDQRLTWITGARYKTNRYLLGTLDEKGDYQPDFTDVQAYLTYQLSRRISFELLGYYALNSYAFEPEDRETTFGTIAEIKRLKVYFEGKEADRFQTGYASFSTNFRVTDQQHYKMTFTGFRTFEEESYDIAGAYWLQEVEDPFSNNEDSGTQIGIGEYLQHARNDLLGVVNSIDLEGKYQSAIGQTSWGMQYRHEAFKDNIYEWEMIDSAGYSIPNSGENLELAYHKRANHNLSNHRLSGYLKNEFSFSVAGGHLMVDAGIRASHYSFNAETTFSPRLLLSYLPGGDKNYRFRLSGGYYYQPPFFKEMRRPDGTLNQTIKAQKSIHLVSGYDLYFQKMDRPFKFTAELYYKAMDKLIPYQVDNVRIVYRGENEAKGYAAGIDFKINGELVPGEESWVTLSLMKTEENLYDDAWINPEQSGEPGYIPRPSDQRVNFSVFFQDHLPKYPDFKAHLSFLYGSGLPFGPPRSERYLATNRMPAYRRVDMGFSYDLLRSSSSQKRNILDLKNLWLGLEIFNLPNINNTISYYWVSDIFNRQYAVPNYLTSRRINVKLSAKF
jgi:hypothetical protein